MHIAIIHYHLQPGGVFQVIANHLHSLIKGVDANSKCRVAILHGGSNKEVSDRTWAKAPNFTVTTHAITGLGYDIGLESPVESTRLAESIIATLREQKFSPTESVVHVHNHSLGKNVSLPGAIKIIADRGYPLLLQIHDFAEDFRVEQYQNLNRAWGNSVYPFHEWLYPQGDQIHYAVLNERDRSILAKSGMTSEKLHALPNPIVTPGPMPDKSKVREEMWRTRGISVEQPLVLYPVRGIRRKNIGELLLWSALFKNRASFGITLAPQNDEEQPSYNRWKAVATNLRLPCHFELGNSFSFNENLSSSDAIITTSVAEGFGMVFLESQLAERPLLGRNLPEITAEFEENGIDLSFLYQALNIPIGTVGKDRIYESVLAAYYDAIDRYESSKHYKNEAQNVLNRILSGSEVDFSVLTPPLQEEVIFNTFESQETAESILELNPTLEKSLFGKHSKNTINSNIKAVHNKYDPLSTGQKLKMIYGQVLESSRETAESPLSHGETILESFLTMERFCPIRSMS